MYKRIIVIAFLLLSFMCLSVKGQTAIVYSYDSAGNRTSRATVQVTNVASVPSDMSIDANNKLKSLLPVSKVLSNIASIASGEIEKRAETSHSDKGEVAENASFMWHVGFWESKHPMNEYARSIGKYGWTSLSWIDFYKRNWMGNEALL